MRGPELQNQKSQLCAMVGQMTLFICACIPTHASAEDVRIIHEGLAREGLLAIDIEDSRVMVAGQAGLHLESLDSGATWEERAPLDEKSAVLGVALSTHVALLVGQEGRLWRQEGEGDWRSIDTPSEERWLNVDIDKSGLAVAVGGFGALGISRDFGVSWSPVELDWSKYLDDWYEPHLYDVEVSAEQITIVGEFGLILRSDDGGTTWNGTSQGDESLFALSLSEGGLGYVVGQDGVVLTTTDGGSNWQGCAFRGSSNLFGVASYGSQLVAVGMRQVLRSRDGCRSFEVVGDEHERRGWWQDAVYHKAKNEFLVVGSGARVLSVD